MLGDLEQSRRPDFRYGRGIQGEEVKSGIRRMRRGRVIGLDEIFV